MYTIEYLKKKLHTNRNIKLMEVRLIKRIINMEEKENIILELGDVWSVHDSNVDFGSEERTVKDVYRPVLILEDKTINNYYYDYVEFAPGTSKIHKTDPEILVAKVPPENLRKTTFFLIKFKQYKRFSLLKRKITELSPKLKNKLKEILETNYE